MFHTKSIIITKKRSLSWKLPTSAEKPIKLFKPIRCCQFFRENVKVTFRQSESFEGFEISVFSYPTGREYTSIRTARALVHYVTSQCDTPTSMYSLTELEKSLFEFQRVLVNVSMSEGQTLNAFLTTERITPSWLAHIVLGLRR